MMLRAVAIFIGVCLVLLLATLWLGNSGPAAFATPDDCVNAFYHAMTSADAAGYLDCLARPLREEMQRAYPDARGLQSYLRDATRELKGWALIDGAEFDGAAARLHVEERRLRDRKRILFRLVNGAGAWQIAEMGPPEDLPAVIPYGTHEKELLGGPTR